MAEQVHATLMEGQRVTDFYSARGTHEGCGECCGRFLPLFPHEVIELRHLAEHVSIRPERQGEIDMSCPFLDGWNNCAVYERRPTICRAYDCSLHAAEGMGFAMRAAEYGMQPGMKVYDMREVVA